MLKKYMLNLVVLCSSLLVFTAICLTPAQAAPGDDARSTLEKRINKVIDLMKDPAFTAPDKRTAQIEKINGEILTIFDFEEFSARTIGKRWQAFTSSQKQDFMAAFDKLLTATYLEKMDAYNGESVSYTGTRTSQNGSRVEVQTLIHSGGKDIPVFYQMILKNNAWVVYDVRIEGMSLVENYRSQFSEIFKSGGSIDDLIARVRKLADEMQAKNRNNSSS